MGERNLNTPLMKQYVQFKAQYPEALLLMRVGDFYEAYGEDALTVSKVLGIVLTIFVGVISLEGTLASSVDGITAKTAKAAVSSMIPVVRQNIRRFRRQCFGLWPCFKKCIRSSRSYYNYWDMCSTNYKTCNTNNNV